MPDITRNVQYFPRNRLHPSGALPILDGQFLSEVNTSNVSGTVLYTVGAGKLLLITHLHISATFDAANSNYGITLRTSGGVDYWIHQVSGDSGNNDSCSTNFWPAIIMKEDDEIRNRRGGTCNDRMLNWMGWLVDADGLG